MPFLSHYGDTPDISPRLSIPSLLFLILTTTVVTLRVSAKARQHGQLQTDDWIICLSVLCADALGVLMLLCCAQGFGKHIAVLDKSTVSKTLRYFFLSQIFYKLSLSLTKLSILCFYRRLFHIHPHFRRTCDLLITIVLLWMLAAFFTTVFQCIPVARAYDKSHQGHCINLTATWYANAVFNIASDFAITILPMPVIRSLQINTRDKIMLCVLFALGFLVCVTSILRATTINLAGSQVDRTWYSIDSSMWSVYEDNLAIIGACMPALKRYLANILRLTTKLSTTRRSHESSSNVQLAPLGLTPAVISAGRDRRTRHDEDPLDDQDASKRFSFSVHRDPCHSSGPDNSSEERILQKDHLPLYSITKTREIRMVSEDGKVLTGVNDFA